MNLGIETVMDYLGTNSDGTPDTASERGPVRIGTNRNAPIVCIAWSHADPRDAGQTIWRVQAYQNTKFHGDKAVVLEDIHVPTAEAAYMNLLRMAGIHILPQAG